MPCVDLSVIFNCDNVLLLFLLLADNTDPDEMLNVAFRQGLHCLLRQKRSFGTEINIIWKLQPVNPQIVTSHSYCINKIMISERMFQQNIIKYRGRSRILERDSDIKWFWVALLILFLFFFFYIYISMKMK